MYIISKSLKEIYGDNSEYYQANQNICCGESDENLVILLKQTEILGR